MLTKTFTNSTDFIVVDLETTGLVPPKATIIEVGAVKYSKDEIIDQYSSFVYTSQPVPPFITDITGIRQLDIEDAPKRSDVLKQLIAFCGNTPLIFHNAAFDLRFLNYYSNEWDPGPVYDTLMISRKQMPGHRNHKLQTMLAHFGIDSGNAHRAFDDARATGELFIRLCGMMKHGEVLQQFFY